MAAAARARVAYLLRQLQRAAPWTFTFWENNRLCL
ncbi:ADHFE1 isoform 15 [Pan troglodytes]|uniref:Alcohol dehydrogenase iron containing 1 n=2 Tax=Homininae TaxID=207598 RepID=F2Z3D8_HUMAN|nr:ADHFE1 isoform 10 [Pan troglodytes]PNI40496.1 ADHFE1 isoform 15 [Pan troglodytes]